LPLCSICIPSSVEIIDSQCFDFCYGLRQVTFEPVSKLQEIRESAFARCAALHSICIPSSVQVMGPRCLGDCAGVTFEPGSSLQEVGEWAFPKASTSIPASVEIMDLCHLPSLRFEQYSRLRELRTFLQSSNCATSEVVLPDSLETLRVEIGMTNNHFFALGFGHHSSLLAWKITKSTVYGFHAGEQDRRLFLRVSERCLRLFRSADEFPIRRRRFL
jgi:hypothetical protein